MFKNEKIRPTNKKVYLWVLTLFLGVLISMAGGGTPVFAETSGDYTYTINGDLQTCTITKYNGAGGVVSIPSTLDGHNVTAIGASAFKDVITVTEVTIPNSVITIGNEAFKGMTNVTHISIPNSVTTLGNYAFMLEENLTNLTIPNSVTSIGNQAFSNCYKLETLSLSNRLSTLGSAAFTNCRKLKSIVFPSSLTYIPDSSFMDCSVLENIYIPESVTVIQGWAFHRAPALKTLTIPKSVQTIGSAALYDCKSLTTLYIDGNPTIDVGAFGTIGVNANVPTIYSPTLTTISGYTAISTASYNIIVNTVSNGTIVPSALTGMPGEIIHVKLNPNQGYSPDPAQLTYNDGSGPILINGTSFTMPSKEVTINGGFVQIPVLTVTTPLPNTTDPTPTWSWNDSTGESYFRYNLNGGPWQYTSALEYTPTSELNQGAYTLSVQAMNNKGDWSDSGSAMTTVLPTVTQVNITSMSASVQKGSSLSLNAAVIGTAGPAQTVTWSVTGSVSGAQISQNGLLQVPANETMNTLTVNATSTVDPTKVGTLTITVTEIPPPTLYL